MSLSQLGVLTLLMVVLLMGRWTGVNDDDYHCHHPLAAPGMILKATTLVPCRILSKQEVTTPAPVSHLPMARRYSLYNFLINCVSNSNRVFWLLVVMEILEESHLARRSFCRQKTGGGKAESCQGGNPDQSNSPEVVQRTSSLYTVVDKRFSQGA